ncbi:MAG: energy-coupled thiamine transporter ThiT [Eubacteriaceae bacterium]|jgi:thiamine transporter
MNNSRTKKLVTAGAMIAVATVLSMITLFQLPQGGGITAFSMLPIILMSFRYGPKWGMYTGLGFALIKMMLGFNNVMICPTLVSQIGCILLDYLIPFTLLGSASLFASGFKSKTAGVLAGSIAVGAIMFFCSFLSGILLWGAYAPAGTPVWIYSLIYNGSYMLPETALNALGGVLICRTAPQLFTEQA